MKDFIKQKLHEGLFDDIPRETWVSAYTNKINQLYDGLLTKGAKNKNFEFVLGNEIGYNPVGQPNKCETNVFLFVKENINEYLPVGGFGFSGKNLFPVEHWWVYDIEGKKYIEITPLEGEKFRCYAGIVNNEIQTEIIKAKNFYDVDFFRGGNVQNRYFKL